MRSQSGVCKDKNAVVIALEVENEAIIEAVVCDSKLLLCWVFF